ncbi:ABC transporter permease [Chloroflexota bacterium]
MSAYVIRRLLLMIPTLFLVTIIVFFSVRFIPGSVIDLMVAEMAEEMGQEDILLLEEDLKHRMGLDVPVYVQYGRWLGVVPAAEGGFHGVFQGNLGNSLWRRTSAAEEILQRLPVSIELGSFAIITALLLALPIGIYSAIRQDTAGDYAGRTFAILAISLPSFWLGTIIIVYPSIWWGWMPAVQLISFAENPLGNLGQFLLPGFIMGMTTSGSTMRMTRTMMLEVLRQDYIRTAWAKGLTERTIILRHVLKNALIPVVTILGTHLNILISGTVVIEQIFALPGVGRLMIDALNKRDYPLVSGINLMVSCFVVTMNLLVDLTYGWLDPRVVYK